MKLDANTKLNLINSVPKLSARTCMDGVKRTRKDFRIVGGYYLLLYSISYCATFSSILQIQWECSCLSTVLKSIMIIAIHHVRHYLSTVLYRMSFWKSLFCYYSRASAYRYPRVFISHFLFEISLNIILSLLPIFHRYF